MNEGLSGRELAVDGLLREWARGGGALGTAGAGADSAFVAGVMKRVQDLPGGGPFVGGWGKNLGLWGLGLVLAAITALGVHHMGRGETVQGPSAPESPAAVSTTAPSQSPLPGPDTLLYAAPFREDLAGWSAHPGVGSRVRAVAEGDEMETGIARGVDASLMSATRLTVDGRTVPGMVIESRGMKNSFSAVVLNRDLDEAAIEVSYDVRIADFDPSTNGRWGFFAIGLVRDLHVPPPRHHPLFDAQRSYLEMLGTQEWCHLRITLVRSQSEMGVPGTLQEIYCNGMLILRKRIDFVSSRISIGQVGVRTEIANFRIRRLAPEQAGASEEVF